MTMILFMIVNNILLSNQLRSYNFTLIINQACIGFTLISKAVHGYMFTRYISLIAGNTCKYLLLIQHEMGKAPST